MQDTVLKLPEWIEKNRLDDSLLASAYENADTDIKAAIKSAIALHFEVEHTHLPIRSMRTKGAFVLHDDITSAGAVVYVIHKDFKSPAQLIAGIIPALLAKAPIILVFRDEIDKNILLTIELLGIEHVFVLEEQEIIEKFCLEIYAKYPSLIAVSLGFDHALAHFAWGQSIPFLFYGKNPVILGKTIFFDAAYPDAKIYEKEEDLPPNTRIDIALEGTIESHDVGYPLIIVGAGCEFYTEILFNIENFLSRSRLYTFA